MGRVYGEPAGEQGQAILQKWNLDPDVRLTYRIFDAETFLPDKNGVSGKMTTLYIVADETQTYDCKVFWERVSTEDPGGVDCP